MFVVIKTLAISITLFVISLNIKNGLLAVCHYCKLFAQIVTRTLYTSIFRSFKKRHEHAFVS